MSVMHDSGNLWYRYQFWAQYTVPQYKYLFGRLTSIKISPQLCTLSIHSFHHLFWNPKIEKFSILLVYIIIHYSKLHRHLGDRKRPWSAPADELIAKIFEDILMVDYINGSSTMQISKRKKLSVYRTPIYIDLIGYVYFWPPCPRWAT